MGKITTLLKAKHDVLLKFVEREVTYFSKLNLDYFSFIIDVFNRFPKTYEILDSDVKLIVSDSLKKDYKKRFVSFFDHGLENHIQYIFSPDYNSDYPEKHPLESISSQNVIYISNFLDKEKQNNFIIKVYASSYSFESAKLRYRELIVPHIDSFSAMQLREYLKVSNTNRNIYDSFGVSFSDAKQLLAIKGYDIKFTDFTNLT